MKYFQKYDVSAISDSREQGKAENKIVIEQINAYAEYMRSIESSIDPVLSYLANKVNFGDYSMENMSVRMADSTVELKIIGQNIYSREERMYRLTYSGVSELSFVDDPERSKLIRAMGVLEVTNTEVEVLGHDLFEFRFAFVAGGEMAIRFKNVTVDVQDLPVPQD
ncbi:MAG: hypothetical protein H8F28_25345 [Fibrella sp.]|nr:hypothetical protein [Armatimonadota bacterium]